MTINASPIRPPGRRTWPAFIGGRRRIVTEAALVGAITAHGLLSDTAIVSDDAGQFNVFTHAVCWIHAERHLRRLVCVTDEQRRLVAVQRHLVWWYFRDLKAYKADPTPERRTALRQRFERRRHASGRG